MNRRNFLASLGLGVAAAALPTFKSRRARAATPATPPKRLITYYFCGGVVMDSTLGGTVSTARDGWLPVSGMPVNPTAPTSINLTSAMLTPALSPMAKYLSNMLIVDNVGMVCAYTDPNRAIMNGHEPSALSGLTANVTQYNPAIKYADAASASLDQYIASQVGATTSLKSLNMQTGGSLYHSSFAGPNTRVPNVEDARIIYASDGFATIPTNAAGIAAAQAQAAKLTAQRQLVLNAVNGRFQALEGKVGADDKALLEQSRATLATIGARPIGVAGGGSCTRPTEAPVYIDKYGNILSHANEPAMLGAQIQLAAAALSCDLTRVVNLAHYTNWFSTFLPAVTATDYHGQIEHGNPADPARNAQMNAVLKFEMTTLASLVAALQGLQDSDGSSVFDNTIIMCMSEFGAQTHTVEDPQPFMLLGGKNCGFKTGRHVSYPLTPTAGELRPQPHNNLYVSILQNTFGLNVSKFGSVDCTGPLALMT